MQTHDYLFEKKNCLVRFTVTAVTFIGVFSSKDWTF